MNEPEVNEKYLWVKKSTLPGAGKGLFTKKSIPRGSKIAEYKGKIRKWKDVKDSEADNPYIMYVTRNHIIDAGVIANSKAKFANDAQGLNKVKGTRNNSIYIKEGLRIYIESTKDIPAGSEIFVGYGKEYWDTIKQNKAIELKNKGK